MACWMYLCGLLIFGMCLVSGSSTCGSAMTRVDVKIPHGLPLSDFDRFIVGKKMGELYFAIPRPPAFKPDINYYAIHERSSVMGRYHSISRGETPVANSTCARGNVTLQAFLDADTAMFIRNPDDPTRSGLQVMWSSCPDKYIWSMRCNLGYKVKYRCPLSMVSLGLYLHQTTLDDLPMDAILKDLCPTGITFGAADYKWFYSFGENTLC